MPSTVSRYFNRHRFGRLQNDYFKAGKMAIDLALSQDGFATQFGLLQGFPDQAIHLVGSNALIESI